jgi:hypothetical protein
MRLAFWRAGKDKAVAARAAPKPTPAPVADKPAAAAASEPGDLDLHALGHALMRKRGWIIVPTVLAAVFSIAAVNLITPRYKSEARILIDGRENVFLRPNADRTEERGGLDPEAVTSQVQLLLSRGIRSGAAGPVAAEVAAGLVRDRPRSVLADAGRARARCLL